MRFLLLPLFLLPWVCSAEIFKSVDADGNVVYTDAPDSRAKEFIPPSMNAIPMPKPEPAKEVEKKAEPAGYTSLKVTSPTAEQVIRSNPGILNIQLLSKPKLKTDHFYSVFVDGHMVVRKSNRASIQIPDINRGEHKVYAVVRDAKGKVLKKSNSVTFHMKRQSVNNSSQNSRIGPIGPDGKRIQPGPQQVIFKPGPIQQIPVDAS